MRPITSIDLASREHTTPDGVSLRCGYERAYPVGDSAMLVEYCVKTPMPGRPGVFTNPTKLAVAGLERGDFKMVEGAPTLEAQLPVAPGEPARFLGWSKDKGHAVFSVDKEGKLTPLAIETTLAPKDYVIQVSPSGKLALARGPSSYFVQRQIAIRRIGPAEQLEGPALGAGDGRLEACGSLVAHDAAPEHVAR